MSDFSAHKDKLLYDLQNSEDDYIRKVAAESLGEQGVSDHDIISVLRKTAESDQNKYVRQAAARALENLGIGIEQKEVNMEKAYLTDKDLLFIHTTISIIYIVVIFLNCFIILSLFEYPNAGLSTLLIWTILAIFISRPIIKSGNNMGFIVLASPIVLLGIVFLIAQN